MARATRGTRTAGATGKEFVLAIAQGIAYAAVAVLFGKFAFGRGSDSGQSSSQASSTLAQAPGGILLLILIGAVIAVIGIVFCVNGIRRKWEGRRPPAEVARRRQAADGDRRGRLPRQGARPCSRSASSSSSPAWPETRRSRPVSTGLSRRCAISPSAASCSLCVGVGLVLYGVFLFLRARYDKMD